MRTYLILNLKVSKASMLQTLAVLSPAPVFAAIMAMHALDKKLNDTLSIQGVGLIHLNAKPWIEHLPNKDNYLSRELIQKRGAYTFSSKPKPLSNSMQPVALTDLNWTLLLECGKEPRDSKQVEDVLNRMRLAGGEITYSRVTIYNTLDEALATIGSGFWIDDASSELIQTKSDETALINPVEKLLRKTQDNSWVVPVTLGYALFEEPSIKRGARDNSPHSFAEALLGLIRYTPIRLKKDSITRENLWRYGWNNDHFIVTNRDLLSLSSTYTNPKINQLKE